MAVTSAERYRQRWLVEAPHPKYLLPDHVLSGCFAGSPRKDLSMKHVVFFARHPKLGCVKTRLALEIGPVETLRFYRSTLDKRHPTSGRGSKLADLGKFDTRWIGQ